MRKLRQWLSAAIILTTAFSVNLATPGIDKLSSTESSSAVSPFQKEVCHEKLSKDLKDEFSKLPTFDGLSEKFNSALTTNLRDVNLQLNASIASNSDLFRTMKEELKRSFSKEVTNLSNSYSDRTNKNFENLSIQFESCKSLERKIEETNKKVVNMTKSIGDLILMTSETGKNLKDLNNTCSVICKQEAESQKLELEKLRPEIIEIQTMTKNLINYIVILQSNVTQILAEKASDDENVDDEKKTDIAELMTNLTREFINASAPNFEKLEAKTKVVDHAFWFMLIVIASQVIVMALLLLNILRKAQTLKIQTGNTQNRPKSNGFKDSVKYKENDDIEVQNDMYGYM
ncbi:uncharacterized protein LOC132200188 [Neocloeon triangulifer]|uniref:uncharacterized protein LOC132200188 n=1 Tax=Neocloeon triangulifer TaxID=2078957 RepID=UPI00286F6825|nr:uncharacterized protein LOC132200188 [Neocloeon triangulifer]